MKYFLYGGIFIATLGVVFASNIALPHIFQSTYENTKYISADVLEEVASSVDGRPEMKHVPLPDAVRAVYMTSCVAGTPSFRDTLISLVEETEINSIIIDIKDYSGTISFPPQAEVLLPAWDNARCGTSEMKELVASLHEKGIFVIGRITVFQDPFYSSKHPELAVKRASDGAVWKDGKGLSFIDVAASPYWDYILTLATDSYNIGFDELNFDYVRYPSDGDMKDIAFTHGKDKSKSENLESFFKYLSEGLAETDRYDAFKHVSTGREKTTPYVSVDLFGMTTTNTDDLSIGQVQERAAPYVDFIAPMVYPSHYPNGFMNLGNPNNHPYEVVYAAMSEGARRMQATTTSVEGFLHTRIGTTTPAVYKKPAYSVQKLRPWLQDFDYGGDYGVEEVRAQIKATYDAGLTSWMIWDPSNRYTRGAYLPE